MNYKQVHRTRPRQECALTSSWLFPFQGIENTKKASKVLDTTKLAQDSRAPLISFDILAKMWSNFLTCLKQMNETIDSSEGSPEWEDPNTTLVLETGRPLEDELWFHGVLPRGEVVRLLVRHILALQFFILLAL